MEAIDLKGDGADGYIPIARKFLRQMRAFYSIDARIEAGDSGGYYARELTLPDGAVIRLESNNGLDMIRITVPARATPITFEQLAFPEPPPIEVPDALVPTVEPADNFLAKWPYTETYANLDGQSFFNLTLGEGSGIIASHLSPISTAVTFTTDATTNYRYEDVYEWVRLNAHEDFKPKFLAAVVGAAFGTGNVFSPMDFSTQPGPVDADMPAAGLSFAVGATEFIVDKQVPVTFDVTLGVSVDNGDGTFTPVITSNLPIGVDDRYIAGPAFFPGNSGKWQNEFGGGFVNYGDPPPGYTPIEYYVWTGSAFELMSTSANVVYQDATAPDTITLTPSVLSGASINDGIGIVSFSSEGWQVEAQIISPAALPPEIFTGTAISPFGLLLIPVTIPSLSVTVDNGIVAYGGPVVVSYSGGTPLDFAYTPSLSGGTLLTDSTFLSDPLNLFTGASAMPIPRIVKFQGQFSTGNNWRGFIVTEAVNETITLDHRYRSNPLGYSRYEVNSAAPTAQIVIHWPRADGYGICVFEVPADYEAQLAAAVDADARAAYQASAIDVLLNNFASFDLMATVHHVGEYAILPRVTE